MTIAPKSAIGVAHTMPFTPSAAFMTNINGTSSPPFRKNEMISGCAFFPIDWKIVMTISETEMHGPVTQIMRWNVSPYRTVSGSSMNALTIGYAHVNSSTVKTNAAEKLSANVVSIAFFMRL